MALAMGMHVRCGIEDTLIDQHGNRFTSVQQIQQIVRIAKELGREIANGKNPWRWVIPARGRLAYAIPISPSTSSTSISALATIRWNCLTDWAPTSSATICAPISSGMPES